MTRHLLGFVIVGIVLAALVASFSSLAYKEKEKELVTPTAFLQTLTMPGKLSNDHSALQNDCGACHTAVKGPSPAKCMGCHATNENFTVWPELNFHLAIPNCRACHEEHKGSGTIATNMNHNFIAEMSFNELFANGGTLSGSLQEMSIQENKGHTEKELRCASCHLHSEPHKEMFGQQCGSCHKTDNWMIASFRHPPSTSTVCAQCHRAPPCHFTDHFKRVCGPAAGQPNAKVSECNSCHQVPEWNLIKGVGWYKTH